MSFKWIPYSINDLFFQGDTERFCYRVELKFREDKTKENNDSRNDLKVIIPSIIQELVEIYLDGTKRAELHPVIKCAIVYHEFELLQPLRQEVDLFQGYGWIFAL